MSPSEARDTDETVHKMLADKAFDSEAVHAVVLGDLNALPAILNRNNRKDP